MLARVTLEDIKCGDRGGSTATSCLLARAVDRAKHLTPGTAQAYWDDGERAPDVVRKVKAWCQGQDIQPFSFEVSN